MSVTPSIVFVGEFNPAIFSPEWIRSNEILDVDNEADAQIRVIHPEIADFMIGEVNFSIQRNRLKLTSSMHVVSTLVRISEKILFSCLSHTPLYAVGINFHQDVDFGTFETRNRFGRTIAPLEPWGEWASDLENQDPSLNGGLKTITMRKTVSVSPSKYVEFTIQPSFDGGMREAGVLFNANYHFGLVLPYNERTSEECEDFRPNILDYLQSEHSPLENEFETQCSLFREIPNE